jgi:hypothetical protein
MNQLKSSASNIGQEVRADTICSAAARRPLFIGGGGTPFNLSAAAAQDFQRRAGGGAASWDSWPNFTLSVQYIFTVLPV